MTETISIHGYQYDPASKGKNSPNNFHRDIGKFTGSLIDGFSWYSYPLTFKAFLKAYGKGYFLRPLSATYRAAFDDAKDEAVNLAAKVNAKANPVNLVAHSLGTRVLLQALPYIKQSQINRIVLINGAEKSRNAESLMHSFKWPILNLAVTTDDVLNGLGSWADPGMPGHCIGTHGLHGASHEKWLNVTLDSERTQKIAGLNYGWSLAGDNPKSVADHWYSYKSDSDNYKLVRSFLNGNNLKDLHA